MLKTLMLFALIAASGCLGRLYAKKYSERRAALNELLLAARSIYCEIYEKKNALLPSIKKIAAKSGCLGPFLNSFANAVDRKPFVPVDVLWAECLEKCGAGILGARDRELVKGFGPCVELLCESSNPSLILDKTGELEKLVASLKAEEKSKTKAYSAVGFLAGIFVAIILA